MSQIVPDLIRTAAEAHPERTAVVVDGHDSLTYGQWEARSNRLARWLAKRIQPGDRVALSCTNQYGIAYLIAYLSVHKAGGVNVPLNPALTARERSHILRHSGARIVLGPENIPSTGRGSKGEFQVDRRPDDLADILYTSGTTGTPKGVACTHDNILFRGSSKLTRLFEGATLLHALPLFTFAGTHAMSLICLRGGMTHVLQPRFDAARFVDLLSAREVALAYVVPAMALRLLDEPALAAGVTSLRLLMYGTAPMPAPAVRRLGAILPTTLLVNLYGLTEGGAAVCSLPPHEALRRPDSLGKPLPPTEVRVARDDGTEAAADEDGEIWLRTACRPRWYFDDDDATATAWTDGWLRTGDVGHLDSDGYLYLVDRKKDLIIAGGHNISALEVEDALLEHPAVREAAVVGEAHPVMGEVPRACVVLRHDAKAAELEAFLKERLSEHKVPRTYTFLSELPRNALGKVLKRELRG